MKKLFFFVFVTGFLSCNNSGTSTGSKDSTGTNQTNVENVNGNMPDSNSGMTLNRSMPTDSSGLKDSVRQ
jgi:hypothetical protein